MEFVEEFPVLYDTGDSSLSSLADLLNLTK